MENNSSQKNSTVPIGDTIFQPTPSEIIFDTYEPFGVYQAKLSLRNSDSVARRLKVQAPDSQFFQISAPRTMSKQQTLRDGKIAAGMEICYVITFKPQERREYTLDLVCSSEREKFIIPIRARGTHAALNFPDQIEFGMCPVKAPEAKALTVYNIGSQGSQFCFRTTAPYTVTPESASIDQGAALQLNFVFTPLTTGTVAGQGELSVEDEQGHVSYVKLIGEGVEVDAYLGQELLEIDPTFISLLSHKSVKIYNQSDHPVSFTWKSFASHYEEDQEKLRLTQELERMEDTELTQVLESEYVENQEKEDADALSSDEEENELLDLDFQGLSGAKRDMVLAVKKKYHYLRKAVEEDPMTFVNECFTIEPQTSTIWANSEIEVMMTFRPEVESTYNSVAYLDILGRVDRLPLAIVGQGIGPTASFSYDVLDIGDVYLNQAHRYELVLQNEGDIQVKYALEKNTSFFGSKFQFDPSQGMLNLGKSQPIQAIFCSDVLGEFAETFRFQLRGSENPLCVLFKGCVIGPTFEANVNEIDYGLTSYSFKHTREIVLQNVCAIPMEFELRIPSNDKLSHSEFQIFPRTGTIAPHSKKYIRIEFTPNHVKTYVDYYISVDVRGVGKDLLMIPISATCEVPLVTARDRELAYGECFLRFAETRDLVLVNHSSNLFARYRIIPQDEYSKSLASFHSEEFTGVIEPAGSLGVDLSLMCERIGNVRLPISVEIVGSKEVPLSVTLTGLGKGPNVVPNVTEIDFGPRACLLNHQQELVLHNQSRIPAEFKTFVKSARSKFSVPLQEGILAPDQSTGLDIIANLDDTIAFADELHILIIEGDNLMIPLKARGTGTTMWCERNLEVIDFEHQFTNRQCEWQCTLENKGKRNQVITWINTSEALAEMEAKSTILVGKKESKKNSRRKNSKSTTQSMISDFVPVFTVVPDTITLKPRTACTFTFTGTSTNSGESTEILVCETKVGNDKKTTQAFSTQIKANFINPMLEPSTPSLQFSYVYAPDVPMTIQSKPLTLKNVAQLPLSFVLRTQVPFTLDTWECALNPGEDITIQVDFDPGYKDDRQSHEVKGELVAVFRNHPHRDKVELNAEIAFPNLDFESRDINFDCIFNDSSKSKVIKITNTSSVDASFHWVFMEEEKDESSSAHNSRSIAVTTSSHEHQKAAPIPINQVFDILPIRARLLPGETEEVEFTYYGHANRKFKGQVQCVVEGGPDYELKLRGEASSVSYRLDKQHLDFGPILYNKCEERDLTIFNTGKVNFSYRVRLHKLSREGIVSVSPMSGEIPAFDKTKLKIKFLPGVPDQLVENIVLEVAHFPTIDFKVYGSGIFAAFTTNLPREAHLQCAVAGEAPLWPELKRQAKLNLLNPRPEVVPPQFYSDDHASNLSSLSPSISTGSAPVNTSRMGTSRMGTSRTGTSRMGANNGDNTTRGGTMTSRTGGMTTSRTNVSSREGGNQKRGGITSDSLAGLLGTPAPIPQPISAPKSVHPIDVEIEAGRVFFMNYLTHMLEVSKSKPDMAMIEEVEGEHAEDDDTASLVPQLKLASEDSSLSMKAKNNSEKTKGEQAIVEKDAASQSPTSSETDEFLFSQYVVDLGYVIPGSNKSKSFKLTNTGKIPISFTIDKNLCAARGFSIEPEQIIRLPEKECVTMKVLFQSRKSMHLGRYQVDLNIEMKNAPKIMLSLRALVTMPDISIMHEALDFGKIKIGQSRVMYTQFHNISPVPVEWGIKNPMGSAKDLPYFQVSPEHGTLAPGTKINIKVDFRPREERHHQLALPIKITSNVKKQRNLIFKGEGKALRLAFDPPMVKLGDLLPYDDCKSAKVLIRNDSEYPIEVYSLDFDEKYKEEEQILKEASIPDDEGFIHLSIREPGEELPDWLLREHSERVKRIQQLEEAEKAGDSDEDENEAKGSVDQEEQKPTDEDIVIPNDENVLPVTPSKRDQNTALDYILTGPSCSGVTTQAKLLAQVSGLLYWTLDQAILAASALSTDLGHQVRTELGLIVGHSEDPMDLPAGEKDDEKSKENESVEGDELTEGTLSSSEEEENQEDSPKVSSALLMQILQWQMQESEFENGSVLDSIDSTLASFDDAFEAVRQVLSHAIVISLSFSTTSYQVQVIDALREAEDRIAKEEQEIAENTAIEKNGTIDEEENDGKDEVPLVDDNVEADILKPSTENPSTLFETENVNENENIIPSQTDEELAAEAKINEARRRLIQVPLNDAEKLEALNSSEVSYRQNLDQYHSSLEEIQTRWHEGINSKTLIEHQEGQDEEDKTVPSPDAEETSQVTENEEEKEESSESGTEKETLDKVNNKTPEIKPLSIVKVQIQDGCSIALIQSSMKKMLEKYFREKKYRNLALPEPETTQLVKRSTVRRNRKTISRFGISLSSQEEDESTLASSDIHAEDHQKGEKDSVNENEITKTIQSSSYRWIIPSKESIPIWINFHSADVGTYDCVMGFEIVGGSKEYNLIGHGDCSVPSINSDPRNVFMNRVKTGGKPNHAPKKYVLSRSTFEFGSLLIGKDADLRHNAPDTVQYAQTRQKNGETFQISNSGQFPVHVDFCFTNDGTDEQTTTFPFYLEPTSLDLVQGETKEITVWAFPTTTEVYKTQLVGCIEQNPEPIIFPISCLGASPSIALAGPWLLNNDKAETSAAETTTTDNECPPAILDFNRLLLGQMDEQQFSIENTACIPIEWHINTDDLSPSFKIQPTHGILRPFEKTKPTVIFEAVEEQAYDFVIQVQFSDTEGGMQQLLEKGTDDPANKDSSIQVRAEAYRIDVCLLETLNDQVSNGKLDFGLLRVGASKDESFRLRNNGKYTIGFAFNIRKAGSRKLFTIEPLEGTIDPEEHVDIHVIFKSLDEVLLRDNSDIRCAIMEHETGEVHHEFSIVTTVRSVFSRFRLQPQRGVSFGALRFNEEPKSKRVEIRNEGEFPFQFRILSAKDSTTEPLTLETEFSSTEQELNCGQFNLSPACGSIDPGTVFPFQIMFKPKGASVYHESVRIEISGRNPNHQTETANLIYELSGESCYPGIQTSDYEVLFEEQAVVSTSASNNSNATQQKQHSVYSVEENRFNFGAIVLSTAQKGICERFKISNPNKIQAVVNFNILNNDAKIFQLEPRQWTIPPHEHRYVQVSFHPTGMDTYTSLFDATVEDGSANPTTSKIEFEITGQGTMPCITIEKPVERTSSGFLNLNFGKVRLQKKKTLPLVVRNDGIVPATVLFNLENSPNFSFPEQHGSVTLSPMSAETFQIQYRPLALSNDAANTEGDQVILKLNVLHNHYDETTIVLTGSGYQEYITFEDLPQDREDELHFEDCNLSHAVKMEETNEEGESSVPSNGIQFVLRNHAKTPVRFEWPTLKNFTFQPSLGHLPPKSTKSITACFHSTEAIQIEKELVTLAVLAIQYLTESAEDMPVVPVENWDNSMTCVRYDEAGQATVETMAEPVYESATGLDPESSKPVQLLCSARADVLSYRCSISEVAFQPTFMFQSCVYEFTVTNESKIALPYTWEWTPSEVRSSSSSRGSIVSSSSSSIPRPFAISPPHGTIEAQDEATFVLRFHPSEVENFRYQLMFKSDQRSTSSPIVLPISGKSKRPVCHIDVQPSDYAVIRRSANLPGPKGELGPLDPNIRVVEMASLGIRVRNTKRFFVVNPMNISYEFNWRPIGSPVASFRCASPSGLMLAGKKCEMVFEFTPNSACLVEAFYAFAIPQFNIEQVFLFVGTTSEPNIVLDRSCLNFSTLLMGTKATASATLINHEDIPFHFNFERSSYDIAHVTGEPASLALHPTQGAIPPNGALPIEITFSPEEEREYNFNLICQVKRKPAKLSLNVKGEGYAIHDGITCGDVPLTLGSKSPNLVDFGVLRVNEKSTKSVVISNAGKVNFEFHWSNPKNPMLTIEPARGTVRKSDRQVCTMMFNPVRATSLEGLVLTCTTAGSRVYRLNVSGSAVPPAVSFSFTSHDFGPCFIAQPGESPNPEVATLRISNHDPEDHISVDCVFEKTPYLRAECPATVLSPGQVLDVPIRFTARQEYCYHDTLVFVLNGTSTVDVRVSGEGIFTNLVLARALNQNLDFGALQIGTSVSRLVKLVNKSRRATAFQLAWDTTSTGLSFHPSSGTLGPRESSEIEVRFGLVSRI